jgi:hypothetical protein
MNGNNKENHKKAHTKPNRTPKITHRSPKAAPPNPSLPLYKKTKKNNFQTQTR